MKSKRREGTARAVAPPSPRSGISTQNTKMLQSTSKSLSTPSHTFCPVSAFALTFAPPVAFACARTGSDSVQSVTPRRHAERRRWLQWRTPFFRKYTMRATTRERCFPLLHTTYKSLLDCSSVTPRLTMSRTPFPSFLTSQSSMASRQSEKAPFPNTKHGSGSLHT